MNVRNYRHFGLFFGLNKRKFVKKKPKESIQGIEE